MPLRQAGDWVDRARAYTAATRRNQASAPLAGNPQAADFAGKISDLYMGLRSSAEDIAEDARDRMTNQRTSLMSQFADVDKTIGAARANSGNYQSSIARMLGLEDALKGPGVETADQQFNQLNALNATNRGNQLASFDLIRNTYGDMLNRGYLNYDNLAAQDLSNLYTQIAAMQGMGGGSSGGGGSGGSGGRGGGGRGRSSRGRSSRGRSGGGSGYDGGGFGGTDYLPESTSFIAINPYNPPSGSTYSSDYVRRDFDPKSIGQIRAKAAPRRIVKKKVGGGGGGGRHNR